MLPKAILRLTSTLLISVITFAVVLVSPANVGITSGPIGPPVPEEFQPSKSPPRLHCDAVYLFDNTNKQPLLNRNGYEVRPIASITKLLTALTFLDFDVDWDKEVKMTMEDVVNSSRSTLRAGLVYRVRDLFHASLMSSDNRATRAMVRATGLEEVEFVTRMNRKARELGLLTISAEEVTGLSANNVGSAVDCARLLNLALENETIRDALCRSDYSFTTVQRKRWFTLGNTNRLLYGRWEVNGGKTGYILEAGWCLVVRVLDDDGSDLTSVVLGAPSNEQRFIQTARLCNWGFEELRQQTPLLSEKS